MKKCGAKEYERLHSSCLVQKGAACGNVEDDLSAGGVLLVESVDEFFQEKKETLSEKFDIEGQNDGEFTIVYGYVS